MAAEHAGRTGETTERVAPGTDTTPPRAELAIEWIVESRIVGVDPLRGARLRIGRGSECHLRLDHPSVSRQHAELCRQGPIYTLKDFASTNGSFVNGEPLANTAISAGDVLRFGDCIGVVLSLPPSTAGAGFGRLAEGLMGGPGLGAALAQVKAAAATTVPIVVVGEPGVGKEQVARAVHEWSRRPGPFRAVHCSALSGPSAEAELFGDERGGATGGASSQGHFRAADGGTLFLDELGELPLDMQAKLLRVVERGEVVPLGSSRPASVDVRIVAAAPASLAALVEQGRFRADFAARLFGFVAHVAPLRERRDEIPGLCFHFLEKHSTGPTPRVSQALLEWLCLHDWPGNVRELELLLRKLLALHGSEPTLRPSHAQALADGADTTGVRALAKRPPLAEALVQRERRADDADKLARALEATRGNVKAAAESIGISRARAYRLLNAAKADGAQPDEQEPETPRDDPR